MLKTVFILLFLIKCFHRIYKQKSIFITIREKYGSTAMKHLRQFEKVTLKEIRLEQNNEYLRICLIYNVIPKFIRFKPFNKQFVHTQKYHGICRTMTSSLLKEQEKRLKKLKTEVSMLQSLIKSMVNHLIWFEITSHINSIVKKEKQLINERQKKKLLSLNVPIKGSGYNNKLVYNYSYRSLTEGEEKLLSNGWKYAMNVKKVNQLNVKTDIEYMYYCMNNNSLLKNMNTANKVKGILNEIGNKIKKKIDNEIPNLTKEESIAISSLLNDRSLVISKVDKGNAVVVMNKADYLNKSKTILSDERAFKKLEYNPTDEREKEFIKFLLQLKRNKMITNEEYKLIRPKTGSRTPEAYFLVKVHKAGQPVRPIISSYDAYNYNAAKYLACLLSPAVSKCPSFVKDSFHFANIIKENLEVPGVLCSFDVSSLFTNVPLEPAINIAMKKIKQFHPKLKIDDKNMKELFYYCTKRTNFTFNNQNYDQTNGVSMGSPVAPILAHLFMCELEEKIQQYKGNKPLLYRRYVDDIFMIIHGTQRDVLSLVKYMNKLENSIKFTVEVQQNNKLPFLDVMVERVDGKLITYVYRKPTDTGLFLKWSSNQPKNYKINLIKCLCIRAKRICSSEFLFKQQLEYLTNIFITNGYPRNVIKKAMRSIKFPNNNNNNNIPKVFIPVPYYGSCSFLLANRIRKLIKIPTVRIIFGFKAGNRISSLFGKSFRYSTDQNKVVYGYSCQNCNGYYIGQTARGIEIRKQEHKNAFDGRGYSRIAEHCQKENHRNNWDCELLATESNDIKRQIKESLLMDLYDKKDDRIVYSQKSFVLKVF